MNWETIFGGLALTLPTAAVGYLSYRAGRKKDAVSAQSGIVSDHRAGIEQIIQGYDKLLEQAQDTIKDDREVKTLLEARIENQRQRIEEYTAGWDACMKENARLRRKYGDNGV